jgi:hypothetical protein
MKKFTIFKTPQEEDVQVVAPFETKKKQHPKKVTSKKKVSQGRRRSNGEGNISALTKKICTISNLNQPIDYHL